MFDFLLVVQTLMSAGSQGCVEREVSAGIWRAVLTAAASWDTESTTEQSPFTLTETRLPAEVKLHQQFIHSKAQV